MSVRVRIVLLLLITLVAMTSIGAYSILQTRRNATAVKVVTENIMPSALASADLVAQLKDVQLAAMSVVTAPDAGLAKSASDRLATHKATLQKGIDLQQEKASNDTQLGLIAQAKESLGNYFKAIDEMTQFKLAGQQAMAEASLDGTVGQYLVELTQIVDTVRVEKARSKDAAIDALNESLSNAVAAITGATLLATISLSAYRPSAFCFIVR